MENPLHIILAGLSFYTKIMAYLETIAKSVVARVGLVSTTHVTQRL
jgi:hypothetical protein